ncbi:large ribosomal subunit protein bL34m [Lepisosteus oculatus]|uniref:large ribosomal subunit protein bL34m n=1 Tax=Lepisosteus oculatus TaxID=7918 RepID=UPI00371D1317
MNFCRSTSLLFSGIRINLSRALLKQGPVCGPSYLRPASSWVLSHAAADHPALPGGLPRRTGAPGPLQGLPWHQQVRTRKRGLEYQPNNIKRKRTHGWIKRISSRGGIEVILRRMLKGRKSLTH